jgi:pyruvate kinase
MKIKILCTLGPASLRPHVIAELDERGVDLFRLNLSHTPLEAVGPTIDFIRAHTTKPLCLDTDGAQVRVGVVEEGLELSEGEVIELVGHPVVGTARRLTLRPAALLAALRAGDLLSVDFDGVLLQVLEADAASARALVLEGGTISSNRAVSVDRAPALPALTPSDIEAIEIGRRKGVRHVALSFARRAEDVSRLRKLAGPDAYVISKIETRAGVRHMDEIIESSDAVIIDRGDLSREIPLAHVPMHQKEIIRRCNAASTPAFVATNLLESMVANRRPTIAEANDIVNTLLDGAHGLVLASETTVGRNPVASVETVVSIVEAFEWSRGRRLVGGSSPLRARRLEFAPTAAAPPARNGSGRPLAS